MGNHCRMMCLRLHEHFCKGSYGSQIMAVCKTDLVDINAYTFKEAMRELKPFFQVKYLKLVM